MHDDISLDESFSNKISINSLIGNMCHNLENNLYHDEETITMIEKFVNDVKFIKNNNLTFCELFGVSILIEKWTTKGRKSDK